MVKTGYVGQLHYAWWDGIETADCTYKHFLTVAEGTANFGNGFYRFSVTLDDAVRVYVDGRLVLDEWHTLTKKFDEAPNKRVKLQSSGKHTFRVEHVELGGFATLSFKLDKIANGINNFLNAGKVTRR